MDYVRAIRSQRFEIRGGRPCLVEAEHSAVKFTPGGKVKATLNLGGEVYFWLVRSVNQKPDPSVMPTDAQLGEAVVKELQSYVERTTRRKS